MIDCLASSLTDVTTQDLDGLLMPPRSVGELTGGLERLIANSELCPQTGRNACTSAEGYRRDHNASRILKLLGIDSGCPR